MAAAAPVLEGEQDLGAGAEIRQLERRGAFSVRADPFLHPKIRRLGFEHAHLILQRNEEPRRRVVRAIMICHSKRIGPRCRAPRRDQQAWRPTV